jgi:hypothetical protein
VSPKYVCLCGRDIEGKVDVLGGRLHSILGCEVVDPMAMATVISALQDALAVIENHVDRDHPVVLKLQQAMEAFRPSGRA